MTTTLNISQLVNDEIDILVNLVNSAYRGESSKQGWTTEAHLLDGIRTDEQSIKTQLSKPGAVMLTAKDEAGKMVGCVYLLKQCSQLYLGMLTVAPHMQAQGIGKELLFAAEKYGRDINCTSVVMTVIDKRTELIGWYKRHGYQSSGEIRPFPASPSVGIPNQPLQLMVLEKKI